jgi:HNH endonuclease
MNPLYPNVARRAGHRCEYCRAPEAIFNIPFEVEHIIPSAQEGADDESNLALACRACNLRKSDHRMGTDEQTGNEVSLFDPRRDRWEDHFQVDQASARIEGITAAGHATANRLQMNSVVQLEARLLWMRLGLFP